MIDFIRNKIKGKSILILGFGREGESTFRFFEKHFPDIKISVADKNENIHKKRARMAAGSGEQMRKPGSKGAPSKADFIKSAKTAKKGGK